jgi:hypothetical protein
VTALVWRQTSFTTRLDDTELAAALAPTSRPRDAQHAIEEVVSRFNERRPGMDRWAALLVGASQRPDEPVRVMAAWAMQFDPGRAEFVARLREMVAGDASPLVRRNAACALAASGDASGRPTLREMLSATTVTAPAAGVVSGLPGVDVPVRENAVVGRVRREDGSDVDVRAEVPGTIVERRVPDGGRTAAGEALLVVGPDARHALEAAKALALVGTTDDLDLLTAAADPRSRFPDEVTGAAHAAADAIRARGR